MNPLPKSAGIAAAVVGALTGGSALILAITQPDVSACISKLAGLAGTHVETIVIGVLGVITTLAPIVASLSHSSATPAPSNTSK